jgi:Parvulin-like peptidyl-prolyl isomerase
MFQHKPVTYLALAVSIAALLLSAGCEKTQTPPANPSPEPSVTTAVAATATATQEPTPTSIPAAAIVNGEPIPLSYFNNEVWRYRDSLAGQDVKPDDAKINQAVINYLIEQQLLAQESRKGGFTLSESELQTRIDGLIAELGSQDAFSTWLTNNHYDDAEFRMALTLATQAAWQRDQISATIPDAVEQVRARQIFAITPEGAQRALISLNSGSDFGKLAWEYSPESGGELGWFPRGYLLYPEVEEAAFSLEVGGRSEIIQTEIGYHIIEVQAHESAHPLTTDARIALQTKALQDWLSTAIANSQIVIQIP